MKRPFFIFFLICSIFVSIVVLPTKVENKMKNFESEDITYCFYASDIKQKRDDAFVVNNGIAKMIYCKFSLADDVRKDIVDLYGESICIKNCCQNDYDKINNFINAQKIMEEVVDNVKVYYCYDNSFSECIFVKSQKVNCQIAISKSQITIGFPIILGEF